MLVIFASVARTFCPLFGFHAVRGDNDIHIAMHHTELT
jgi:hypothetical protein